uniref:Uncharacterized protein n=1 Tax=Phaeodactylum tricornutum TaxID=2850 RepID=A0A8J9TD55_PHATR
MNRAAAVPASTNTTNNTETVAPLTAPVSVVVTYRIPVASIDSSLPSPGSAATHVPNDRYSSTFRFDDTSVDDTHDTRLGLPLGTVPIKPPAGILRLQWHARSRTATGTPTGGSLAVFDYPVSSRRKPTMTFLTRVIREEQQSSQNPTIKKPRTDS